MLLTLALTLVGLVAFVAVAQRYVLFPRPAAEGSPASRIPGLEALSIGPASDVEAWLLAPNHGTRPHPVVIFAHGNAELIDHWVALFEPLRDAGFAVLLVEFPGYGRSGGSPSQASVTETFLDAYDRVVARPEIRDDAVVGYGRSLGGAAICQLAARRPLRGLILESTFRGVRPIAAQLGIPGWLVRDPFDSEAVLAGYANPVLLLHGERDQIVPVAHARALDRATPDSQLVTYACGHNDCPRRWRPILDFLSGRLGLGMRPAR